MIVIRLIGGLGNQMFQYAFGRYLSIKNNIEVKYDISDLIRKEPGNYTIRDFDLSSFNIHESFTTEEELKYFDKFNDLCFKVLYKLKPYYKRPIILEKDLIYNSRFLKINHNCYLNGYWQSEKYFIDIRTAILKDFTLKHNLSEKAQNTAINIKKNMSVSLHIRRGDYISKYSDLYHILNDDYYEQALEYLNNYLVDFKVFVFSDDIEWVKDKYSTKANFHIVESNLSYEDIYLMSLCKHNIIANSSFSWWGAWLNINDNKICIAPSNWFIDNDKKNDIIPNTWIVL
jgi:hypothetical protein